MYSIQTMLSVTFFNQSQEAGGGVLVQLSGSTVSVPITSDDKAKFKLENERNYHLLLTAVFS